MANKISTKYIGDEAVGSEKFELQNNTTLQGKNVANTASLDILKIDTANKLQFLMPINLPSAATDASHAVRKQELDAVIASMNERYATTNSTPASTTSTTTWTTFLTLSPTSLLAGNYRVDWGLHGSQSNNGRSSEVRVRVDGVTVFSERYFAQNAAVRLHPNGFVNLANLSAGSHTITVDFRVGPNGGSTSTMSLGNMELYKVGH